ncbi:Vacuolar protein sorting-associated protein 9a [Cytospora mali]|uniref:Vacuolar protein sorting-associated protein 9a n=1 Tax=Cytospora mali TaxID=578113 RepID=A0A194VID6_CYTMA|nr:Vacuolar protein sorting-associated protein 9a [Valsa mali]
MSPPFTPNDLSHPGLQEHDPNAALAEVKSSMEPEPKPELQTSSHYEAMAAESKPATGQPNPSDDLISLEEQPNEPYETPVQHGQAHDNELELEEVRPEVPPKTDDGVEGMTASVATLKPDTSTSTTTATRYLNIESKQYIDPTPPTPTASQPPSRTPSNAGDRPRVSLDSSQGGRSDDEKRPTSDDERELDRSEIQNIMAQFKEGGSGPGEDEVMSPRLEIASPFSAGTNQHPPRRSSLEPFTPNFSQQIQEMQNLRLGASSPAGMQSKGKDPDDQGPPVPPKDPSIRSGRTGQLKEDLDSIGAPMSPTVSLHRPPPPEPEPESALPFDFHRFLEQLRNKKADPVAKYLRSFLNEFGKRQWMVHEQVKIISDFLAFIANKMALCDVWKDVSDAEFDNAREGMEKLVMNRLYSQAFSPAIPPPQPIPGAKPRRKGAERPMGPGRRGQHQEDVERDEVVAQKIKIYGWVREEHLDIPPVGESGKRFLRLAQQELLKIKSYRAPRDKIICILNCCKVIFGLLKHSKSDSSADSFMPLLIYVVLQGNPEHIVSNVQYILRFRNQEKLGGEAGYYLSSLMGAIQFIENMDRTTLTISDEEFERNVEAAVSAIAERHRLESPPTSATAERPPQSLSGLGESSSTRPSMDNDAVAHSYTERRSTSSNEDSGEYDEKAAITGLLRSIQKPLSTIGRMFSDSDEPLIGSSSASARSPAHTPQPEARAASQYSRYSAEEAAARQASAETAEAQRLHRAEHANIVETLAGMFPDLDKEIISDVVYQKEGRVGLAVDACLALSS